MNKKWVYRRIAVGPLQCNCQLLACPETMEAALIDPGADSERIMEMILSVEEEMGASLRLKTLFHTHAHFDHIGATREVKESLMQKQKDWIPEIYLHPQDEEMYRNLKLQGQFFGFHYDHDPLDVNQFLKDEQEVLIGKMKFTILHTPGHSPGSVCFRLHEDSSFGISEMLFSGDTLFQKSIGRTDFLGGDSELILKSIRQRIFSLDPDTPVYPGHGPQTLVGI